MERKAEKKALRQARLTDEERKAEIYKKTKREFAMQLRMASHTIVVLGTPYYREALGMWQAPAPGCVFEETHLFVLDTKLLGHTGVINFPQKNQMKQSQAKEVQRDERNSLIQLSMAMEDSVMQAGAFNSFKQNIDPYCQVWDLAKYDMRNTSIWDFSHKLRTNLKLEAKCPG